jgi:hypothetical protein
MDQGPSTTVTYAHESNSDSNNNLMYAHSIQHVCPQQPAGSDQKATKEGKLPLRSKANEAPNDPPKPSYSQETGLIAECSTKSAPARLVSQQVTQKQVCLEIIFF